MALAQLEPWSSCAVFSGLKFVLTFWAVVILCTLYFEKFSAISHIIIFVIRRSAKNYVHGEVHE